MASGWCLAGIVLVNVYKGRLTASLTVPKYEPVVNSFEDMARSKTLQLGVFKGSIIEETLLVIEVK